MPVALKASVQPLSAKIDILVDFTWQIFTSSSTNCMVQIKATVSFSRNTSLVRSPLIFLQKKARDVASFLRLPAVFGDENAPTLSLNLRLFHAPNTAKNVRSLSCTLGENYRGTCLLLRLYYVSSPNAVGFTGLLVFPF